MSFVTKQLVIVIYDHAEMNLPPGYVAVCAEQGRSICLGIGLIKHGFHAFFL